MKTGFCEQEQRVLDALRLGKWAGPWGEELRRHAAGCAACSEVVWAAEALQREAELARAAVRVPSAGLMWWKAQLAARRAAAERATQPIAMVERAALVFGALVAIGLALLYGPGLLGWWGKTRVPGRASGGWAAGVDMARHLALFLPPASSHFPVSLIAGSVGTLVLLMAFAAYVIWREE